MALRTAEGPLAEITNLITRFTTAVPTEKVVARGGLNLQGSGTVTCTFANAAQVFGVQRKKVPRFRRNRASSH